MSRTHRLLNLIQLLRQNRFPVTGQTLAEQLDVSVRTIYRDIATLQQQGADIQGEPGLGFVLRPGFLLPPLMFQEEEIEALVLGVQLAARHGDAQLSTAARTALSKIAAVLPAESSAALEASALVVVPSAQPPSGEPLLLPIRQAIRGERKLVIGYRDRQTVESTRTIWPIILGFFDHVRVVVGWCELRQSFRHFRVDRISRLDIQEQRYPRRRAVLVRAWRESEGIPHP